MSEPALLGVDIGTTALKAVAFSPDGTQLARASRPTQAISPHRDWAELDPDTLWHSLATIIRDAISQLDPTTQLRAVAFTGMAEAGLPLDTDGTPLYPAITWYDRRVLPQMAGWQKQVGAERTARITGLPIIPACGVLRPLWLRKNHPEIFDRTQVWLNLPDWAAFMLCGEKATEYSLASRMMILDLDQKQWSAELLTQADLPGSFFGRLVPSGMQIGSVHKEAAGLTGLPEGLPVCTAGHDHLCAAVGLGVTANGDLFDSIGTAEALLAALPQRNNDATIAKAGIAQGWHILPDRYYAISGNAYGGGSIEWARTLIQGFDQTLSYGKLNDLVRHVPAGSGGVFFLPHLRQGNPPTPDPASRGAFVGLSSDSNASTLARAVFEGLGYECQRLLHSISTLFDLRPERLVATGGGTRNEAFLKIKSDISGLPVSVPNVEEATCLGAAYAAGIGAGIYRDFDEAVSMASHPETVIEPDMAANSFYKERYESVYLSLYESLKHIHHDISTSIGSENKYTA